MKKILFIGIIALALCTCAIIDGLPEPELPVGNINFSNAQCITTSNTTINDDGTSTTTITKKIVITFDAANTDFTMSDYDGIYSYYNKTLFDMKLHIKEGGANIESSVWDTSSITVKLGKGKDPPEKLVFDTKAPLYLYKRQVHWSDVITDKAFIKTPELTILVMP
jgi:hypothetical protein